MRGILGHTSSLLVCGLFLTACGTPPSSPLSEAVTALRTGDHQAFAAAKAKAEAAVKTTHTPAQMRCNALVPYELRRRSEMNAIRKFDRETLFARNEDERLVYALNIVGSGVHLDYDDPYIRRLREVGSDDIGNSKSCPPLSDQQRAELDVEIDQDRQSELALRGALADWIAARKSEYGEEKFQSNLKSAAGRMTSGGYPSKWPTKVVLNDSDD